MARIWRHCAGAIVALALLSALFVAPAATQDLYDQPVLAVDPGMHTALMTGQSVDREGRFAVTGGADRTVRIWSVAGGKLLRTIWIPAGPDPVGEINAVAINPDGTTIAAGGYTERLQGGTVIYLFERESGALVTRIHGDLPDIVNFLTFSPDGRYLAATLGAEGIRVFDRDKDWDEAFRDGAYGDQSYGASFAPDGRLATTSLDGKIWLYRYDPSAISANFRRVGELVEAPSGHRPFQIAFSPDGRRLAVGYEDIAAVDVLDGTTLTRVGGQSPGNATPSLDGLTRVEWSRDGQTLFAAGGVHDSQSRWLLFAWDRGGLGDERRMTYCAQDTATGVNALTDARILVASLTPCLGLMDAHGEPTWTVSLPILDFRGQHDVIKISQDGEVVDFGDRGSAGAVLRFDVRSLALSRAPPNDDVTYPSNREGLAIADWLEGTRPTLGGRTLPLVAYDTARSLAIAPDAKRFFLGSSFGVTAFDDAGAQKWRRLTRGAVWAVNASRDGRIVVTAGGDGTIRWRRADDGRELLALQVLPNKTDWVLWSPEGFYEATPGAEDVLKWVVNHGPDSAATTLPVSTIPKLHRPDALRFVLDQLETARALGIADVSEARLLVQTATGSAKPPGAVLHVLAIGIDHFGDKAGGLHLDYAVDDARDVANALLTSQEIAPGKVSLYADVSLQYLLDDKAARTGILEAMDTMASNMRGSGSEQDVAVILFSGHGEIIEDKFYLIPYGVDVSTPTRMETTAIWVEEFAAKVKHLAELGKVLLLLDACHSDAVGPGGSSAILDASVLRNAVNMDNVTVLTSSQKDELSREDPAWKHGAFTKAFLDAIGGGADPLGRGVISTGELAKAMKDEVERLTRGEQHLGMHLNFADDVFVVSH